MVAEGGDRPTDHSAADRAIEYPLEVCVAFVAFQVTGRVTAAAARRPLHRLSPMRNAHV
jgi:hypothetical protein